MQVIPSTADAGPQLERPLTDRVRQYSEILRKRAWIIAAIVAVGVTGTVLYTMRQPRVYEASATVIVNPQAPRVNKDDDVIELGAGSWTYMRDYYNTQIRVLISYPLAQATVQESLGATPIYDRLAPRDELPNLSDEKRSAIAAERLLGMLRAVQDRDSRIIAIRARNVDPELAQALANAHVQSYMAYMRGKRTVGTGQASHVLNAQLDDARKQLRASEDKIIDFKSKHDLTTQSFDDRQNTVVAELQRYSAALADARVKRIELGAQRDRAKALTGDDVLVSPIFALASNESVFNTLKGDYIQATQRFVEVDAKYGPKTEEYRAAKQKVDELHAQLQNEATRAMREIDERYQAVLEAESGYEKLVAERKKDVEELDKLYGEYAPLLRDQKDAEIEYNKLVSRLDSSREEGRNDLINVEPHELARAAYQVLPRMKVNVVLATILSLLLAIGLAFLLDYLDRTIKSAEGVEALVGSPVLGIIPLVSDAGGDGDAAVTARDQYVIKHPTSRAAECCRSIRTNILFSAAERSMKTITVSSPRPREGKTTTTIYMGTIMAQSGQRVLLVDTDLRRPRLHSALSVPKERGLTTLLLGESSYDDAVKSTDVPNLFVLPCGPVPPNPAELLLTNRFKTVLGELAQRFDRILLDSPPVLAVTDAVVLARATDGVLLVVQADKTYREDAAQCSRQFRDVGASILGVIVNTIDVSDRRYGGYYYNYYAYGSYGGQPRESEKTAGTG